MVNQKEKTVEINIFLLIQSVWHHAWIIILAMVVTAMLALGYANFFVTPTYSATALAGHRAAILFNFSFMKR